jgi:hypothetical protein
MAIKFRKLSIRSRKRTLGLAGFGMVVEMIASHPRLDMAALANVATVTRFAAPAVLAAVGSWSWKSDDGVTPAAEDVAATPISVPAPVVPEEVRTEPRCPRPHGIAI